MSDDAVISMHGFTILDFMGIPYPLNKLCNTSLFMKENESTKFAFP